MSEVTLQCQLHGSLNQLTLATGHNRPNKTIVIWCSQIVLYFALNMMVIQVWDSYFSVPDNAITSEKQSIMFSLFYLFNYLADRSAI